MKLITEEFLDAQGIACFRVYLEGHLFRTFASKEECEIFLERISKILMVNKKEEK